MYTQLIIIIAILTIHESSTESLVQTTVSEGVNSLGYKVVYGDEDLTVVNQVVTEEEKKTSKSIKLNEAIEALEPQNVKCLMSVDRYCSKEMLEIKKILIKSVKEDCESCSVPEKERAGTVIASLMAHDPVAWKLFLTRSALQVKKKEEQPQQLKQINLRAIGKGEEVIRSPKNMYTGHGIKVRVRRFAAEVIP